MSSMDLDDLDAPIKAPQVTKPSRFLSKSSTVKPESKPKPKPEPPAIDHALGANKKEEEQQRQLDGADVKLIPSHIRDGSSSSSAAAAVDAAASAAVEMDVDEVREDEMNFDGGGEDCVVREIDVYFTPSFDADAQLYLMQYPLRPRYRPYELDEECQEVRLKPISIEVEIDLLRDTHPKNYDPNWGGKKKDGDGLNKLTLTSTRDQPVTSYAIGILSGNKLHLNPINEILAFRPSFDYIDSGASRSRNDATVKSEETKLMGHVDGKNTTDKECWIPLKYHNSKSEYSARYIEKLMVEESVPLLFPMKPYNYVKSLCPGASDNIIDRGSSKRFLLSLPLEERLKKSLCEGDTQVHRYNNLKHLAPDAPVNDFLLLVQKYSVLVQGLWVPKSNLVFREEEGIQKLVRDYILYLFSNSPKITYSEINKLKSAIKERKVGTSKTNFIEFVDQLLKIFAVERKDLNDWKFKEPTDESFIKNHPDIVAEYEQIWDRTGQITKKFVLGNEKKSTKPVIGTSTSSDKGISKVGNGIYTGRKVMSDETREALPKALEVLFKKYAVCSIDTIRQGLRDLAVNTSMVPKADPRLFVVAAQGAEAPIEELKAVISEVATDVHGVYVSKLSYDHPECNQLRQVVIQLLCGSGPNAKLKKAEISEAAKITLKREITQSEFTKAVNEICISSRSGWILKSGDGQPI